MSGSNGDSYNSPNFYIPYSTPSNVPPDLLPIIKPIYIMFQNMIQTLITFCGIASRSPAAVLSSVNDSTAVLANNVHRFYTQSTETIVQGALVNLYASSGQLWVRNASATDGTKQCDGFCSQSGGIPNGTVGEIILGDGMIQGLSGLTPGGRYYLSTAPGSMTLVPPSAPGNLQQSIGIAVTANALKFWTGPQVQH
jgi:hypothetical protein